jgi:hypothetical protein
MPDTAADDARKAADHLVQHSSWMGMAFVAVIFVAVGIELLARILVWVHAIEAGSVLAWEIHIGAWCLAGMDVMTLLAVFGKKSWQFLMRA